MKEGQPAATIYRNAYQPPEFVIEHTELVFSVMDSYTEVTAKLQMHRVDHASTDTPLVLQGVGLDTKKLGIDHQELSDQDYHLSGETLEIMDVPERFVLHSVVRIDPDNNTALEGLYRSGAFYLTQCEAEGFRRMTWFMDRPDVMSTFKVRIEADRTRFPVLLSNGNAVEQGDLGDNRHFVIWDDPFPKPSYLFALVAGDLKSLDDTFRTADGREVALRIWTEPNNLDKLDYAMEALQRSMRWDEDRFGLQYDLDIFQVVVTDDFNMGAMENKSLNIFNSRYVLASPQTATDSDFQGVEGVIGHEYFHNWTGNRVTCRDWFQLTLKEGLTVFRDQEFSADMQSRAVKRIEDVRALRAMQFAEDAGPMAHPIRPDEYQEINNFYTLTVYEKGAEVIRMIHSLLGEQGFQRGMRLYFERHDGQAVTCDDFRAAMADANDVNLDQFERWYSQAGTPVVTATDHYDAQTQQYTMKLHQSVPDTPGQHNKKPMHMPARIALFQDNGSAIAFSHEMAKGDMFELRETETVLTFDHIPSAPVPSLFRGLSAPVRVVYDYSDAQLATLLSAETDPLNAWDAGQQLATRAIFAAYNDPASSALQHLIDAISQVLQSDQDPALIAMALQLPAESALAQQQTPFDPVALHQARNAVKVALAQALKPALRATYDAHQVDAEYAPDPAQMASRSLRNTVLDLLMLTDSGESLALQQYTTADNMTDQFAALKALVLHQCDSAVDKLAAFRAQWQDQTLVLDKWFSVQAMVPDEDLVGRLKSLMQDEAFSIRNPNKVRSVVGAFAFGNPFAFHQPDGSGYDFLADFIIELDALNPQVAARMVSAFNVAPRLAEQFQRRVKASLERISAAPSSKDVREIVSKCLEMLA